MLQNFLAPSSILLIITFYALLRNHPKHKYILPTILSSLGILGTFIGIAVGLYTFDVNNIDKSVPTLLEGLKLAFVSSIAGIIFTIIKKFELSRDEKFEEIEDEEFGEEEKAENVIPILKEMLVQNNYGEKLDELNLKLSGKDDKSMAVLLSDIADEISQLKNQTVENSTTSLEGQINDLLESNKANNEDLKSFIKQLSSSIGIETDSVDNQKQIVSLLQEIISKDDYSSKLDNLSKKLSGQENQSMANL